MESFPAKAGTTIHGLGSCKNQAILAVPEQEGLLTVLLVQDELYHTGTIKLGRVAGEFSQGGSDEIPPHRTGGFVPFDEQFVTNSKRELSPDLAIDFFAKGAAYMAISETERFQADLIIVERGLAGSPPRD